MFPMETSHSTVCKGSTGSNKYSYKRKSTDVAAEVQSWSLALTRLLHIMANLFWATFFSGYGISDRVEGQLMWDSKVSLFRAWKGVIPWREIVLYKRHWWDCISSVVFSFGSLTTRRVLSHLSVCREERQSYWNEENSLWPSSTWKKHINRRGNDC